MEQTLTIKTYQDALPRRSICVSLFQRAGASTSSPVACCHQPLDHTAPLRFTQTRQDRTNATLNHHLATPGSAKTEAI